MNTRGPQLIEVPLGAGVRAAFSTVHGGVSKPPWQGLNLGLNTGDAAQTVRRNRSILEDVWGRPIAFATQVHGRRVGHIAGPIQDLSCGRFDALIVRTGAAAGVLVADCVPILLAEPDARVGAVVHAGRAGLFGGVVEAALGSMRAAGARVDRIRAVVGPAACGRCYEVPEAMRDEVSARVPGTASTTGRGTPALDLPRGALTLLRSLGVQQVEHVDRCTIEDEDFYSHRRSVAHGLPTGRFAGILSLT